MARTKQTSRKTRFYGNTVKARIKRYYRELKKVTSPLKRVVFYEDEEIMVISRESQNVTKSEKKNLYSIN